MAKNDYFDKESEGKKSESKEISLLDSKWDETKKKYKRYMLLAYCTIIVFPLGNLFLILYLNKRKYYLEAKSLRDAGNSYGLLELVKNFYQSFNSSYPQNNLSYIIYSYEQCVYALVDLDNKEIARICYDRLKNPRFLSKTLHLNEIHINALDVLAKRNGYEYNQYLDMFDKETEKDKEKEKKATFGIPISKTYILSKPPQTSKCMISSLPLDFTNDTIVACPFCGSMAEKHLLADWLEEKSTCPVCKKTINIEDCPIVIIKK
ncbi:MAG TPA: hypothetical protein VMX55_03040 [candidate division Zixibacteria bacterium]|nr:hypothetical protein [candidate division Zixibacteria bacterium]